ncbi:MAG: hypothetical protein CVU87_08165 [Firmicutes bacterium HGW-Firmicutes-12]|jgi:hypothetical protein|nr:MAG: hypothetical protein CVU87_08165 [Firmicutes bacterium HGW-Firmicutes-12]
MIYKFYDVAPDTTLKYVETILPLIGNITEFEVFRNKEDSPYVVREEEEIKSYTFILKDQKEDEFWFHTLCGYSGSGPNATLKILQLLGIKEDFHTCEEGNTHIKKRSLNPVHKLNLLVTQDKAKGYNDKDIDYNIVLSMDFKFAYQKHNVLKILKDLGYIQHIIPENKVLYKKSYLFDELDKPKYEYYYYTDNIFTLSPAFRDLSKAQVQTLVKKIITGNNGTINYEADID